MCSQRKNSRSSTEYKIRNVPFSNLESEPLASTEGECIYDLFVPVSPILLDPLHFEFMPSAPLPPLKFGRILSISSELCYL
jgi:hypothetical protein